jgi:nitronate monooxygenase
MVMQTSFTQLVGIAAPVVQAPIGSAVTAELVAAVGAAGGLGMVPGSWTPPGRLAEFIRSVRGRGPQPFGVNLACAWDQRERLQVCLDEGVPVVSLFWGLEPTLIARAREAGALVLQTIGSSQEAAEAVAAGADAVVAQGWDAGGHVWGTVGSLALIPAVVDAVGNTPVVAAGGIGDGRGLAAALVLGAAAGWLGTRFVASREAAAHPRWQQRLVETSEDGTCYTKLFDIGWPDAPHRVLRSSTWEALGAPPPGRRPGEGEVVAHDRSGRDVVRYSDNPPVQGMDGEIEAMAMYAGQSVGVIRDLRPAGDIVTDLVAEARRALARTSNLDR